MSSLFSSDRAIPLYLPRADFYKAMSVLCDGPVFNVLPLRRPKVGILVTGTEVFLGLVEDKFVPIITTKVEPYGGQMLKSLIVPDNRRAIGEGVQDLLDCGIDLLVTTAGLSGDPDDVTRQGLADAGVTDMLYGAPIVPGSMTLLARIGSVQVIGVPACALYFKTSSFDLLLPRLLAGLTPETSTTQDSHFRYADHVDIFCQFGANCRSWQDILHRAKLHHID